MRRSIFTILFSAFVLCLLADKPQQYSYNALRGTKIASVDAYNWNWSKNADTPEIIETDYAMMGKSCYLTPNNSTGDMYLSGFYGDFSIPIHIDLTTGAVTIKAGNNAIGTISNIEWGYNPSSPIAFNAYGPEATTWPETRPHCDRIWPIDRPAGVSKIEPETHWTLYAMPLSRLMGIDDSDTIHGQVNDDGTISFNDDFVFWVKKDIYNWRSFVGKTTWELSPIFKNLKLLIPNGKHEFQYHHWAQRYDARYEKKGPNGSGVGGCVPRPTNTRPGSSKPVSKLYYAGSTPRLNAIPNQEDYERATLLVYEVDTITHEKQPVYMEMVGDSTLMVYNLFGQGNRCYLTINSNDKIVLPSQQIYNDGLGNVLYNNPCNGIWSQNSITWLNTTVTGKDRPIFYFNKLTSNEGWPFIGSPACDACMVRGDVNNDGIVNISDVTAMINCLLSGSQDGLKHENVDCTLDRANNISDVTALINFLLNGNWPD